MAREIRAKKPAFLAAHYGIGPLTAVVVWAELGDCRRFSRSMQVVRHTGLDVTVDQSDRHRGRGHLTRQGPETLRWALLFEAGMAASHATSPDRATTRRSNRHTTASWPPSPLPASSPCAATTRSARWTPSSSTACPPEPDHFGRHRRPGPISNIRVSAVSSWHARARQHSSWTAV